MRKSYDIIYSLGADCSCAEFMKMCDLRATSGPFDWLNNTDFSTRMQCVLDDFKDFFNKTDLRPLAPDIADNFEPVKGYRFYENTRNKFYYFHDFLDDKLFDDMFPFVPAKYDRRIMRFHKNLAQKRRVLLIWFSRNHNTDDKTVVDLCDRVCKKYNKTIDFLIIEHTNNVRVPIIRQLAPNIMRYNLHAISRNSDGTLKFLGRQSAIKEIFSLYKLRTSFLKRVGNILGW